MQPNILIHWIICTFLILNYSILCFFYFWIPLSKNLKIELKKIKSPKRASVWLTLMGKSFRGAVVHLTLKIIERKHFIFPLPLEFVFNDSSPSFPLLTNQNKFLTLICWIRKLGPLEKEQNITFHFQGVPLSNLQIHQHKCRVMHPTPAVLIILRWKALFIYLQTKFVKRSPSSLFFF